MFDDSSGLSMLSVVTLSPPVVKLDVEGDAADRREERCRGIVGDLKGPPPLPRRKAQPARLARAEQARGSPLRKKTAVKKLQDP